ncbi:hypothetical protein [Paenibacillus silvae]|nr:hypothetical protein [Paenibacillus silvae]MCK6150047.1 hypothetical protein [Paenibacillus silvae]MCK6268345.1 hypothetical protein [Paenibacillus silvae]
MQLVSTSQGEVRRSGVLSGGHTIWVEVGQFQLKQAVDQHVAERIRGI